ncbi:GH116 family glycosyl hydrolase [Zobellia galactanivorans]|uniref:GH116 family glycosyl hydrolase n=1 Tax=Zobellia galactanivorans (strain DSM 12802 / CCUG 47099 / CIP 106680 / NCIMB 13871 / Dsij) TaxID=63186 RepID=UPI001C06D0D5|nr:GH116 family glycosyl hydrolase [Zobellia galactanivorans]MBU3024050.1 hypothetical protein [Zobellia galactanivorans]
MFNLIKVNRAKSIKKSTIWYDIFFLLVISFSSFSAISQEEQGPHIPLEKNLNPKWVESLFEKGKQKVYSGDELKYIAMPCGGIGAGQVNVTGDGRLAFTESVYNLQQQPNSGHGLSTGYNYLHPEEPQSKVENTFTIRIEQANGISEELKLDKDDFDDIQFIGEYPIAQVNYRKKSDRLPIEISSEVFSPFVPLSVRSSANPVTVVKYKITNTSKDKIDVSIIGELKNIAFPQPSKVKQVNTALRSKGVSGISFEMQPMSNDSVLAKHPQLGGFSLSVLNQKADLLVNANEKDSKKKRSSSEDPISGSVGSTVSLRSGQTKEITFLVSWYFPNYYENGKRYKDAMAEAPGWVGHIYNNWYANSFDVTKYVASNFNTLYADTKLFRDTYNDNTLPYWLANRITMPVSTLAAGNIAIWKNGRMYGYEGIGFCQGTCGHVYNFVAAISKLFPELERSVRLLQDFNSTEKYSGYSPSGRINFRGYGVNKPEVPHSYASDAQSGYVLKAYREHLNSPNNEFLDTVWEKVKMAIGYHIFKDGAEIGLEPNGVLEGEQTFWDPMWYGPNPYNNTLYLAALRAAEEMAKVKGEPELASRYHKLFESGQKFMNEEMWNGEFYIHLYPVGLNGNVGIKNGFKLPSEIDDNAQSYIKAFNEGRSGYFPGTACDAQQLFGQNWANQLGLGYILSPEKSKIAAKSIFKYNWTPDIATIYDFEKPNARVLAAKGEAAMINGGWTKEKPKSFENTHDKTNVWTGLEYEAACDMINEGLLEEAIVAIRSIDDRYNGTKRNPWNEVEGSNHYSRAMHSWNVLLSLSGFTYNGPEGIIGFKPRLNPDNFKSFFSTAEGWGTFKQVRYGKAQTNTLLLTYGKLELNVVTLDIVEGKELNGVSVKLNGKIIKSSYEQQGNTVLISLSSKLTMNTNDILNVDLK